MSLVLAKVSLWKRIKDLPGVLGVIDDHQAGSLTVRVSSSEAGKGLPKEFKVKVDGKEFTYAVDYEIIREL
jgi:hypothetical protein